MNDSISILVAVFFILIALRWLLGGNQGNNNPSQQGQRRTTTNMPRRVQHRVTPQMIEMVRAMFPDIPTAAIQADLQRTGSVETTVDNALRDGGLPLPASMIAHQQGSSSSAAVNNTNSASTSSIATGSNSRSKSPSHSNLVQRYMIDVHNEANEEPPKVWESSPDKRQEILRKRKEYMVLQARKKMLEQQAQKKKKQEEEKQAELKKEEKEKAFDDMSVEELNSLSAEQRRDQMLQALQKRKNSSSAS